MLRKKNTMYLSAGVLAGLGCLLMIAYPAMALASARKGVALWVSSVLPALLPFFICANFMIALGIPKLVGKFFERSFRAIFDAPGVSAFVFSISITSGYPMGAKLIGDMTRRKEISKDDAMKMLSFCSTSGPLFMLGAVGAGMLGSPSAGVVIAVSHYLGAIGNGLLYRLIFEIKQRLWGKRRGRNGRLRMKSNLQSESEPVNGLPTGSLLDLFTDSMLSAFRSLGIICGYLVLFTLITDFVQSSGVVDDFFAPFGDIFVAGFFEMTVGCSSVASAVDLTFALRCVLCSFLISWGGLSVLAQSMSMLSGLHISVGKYMFMKLSHGLLAGLLAWLMAPWFMGNKALDVGAFGQQQMTEQLGFFSQFLFSTKMIVVVILIFLLTIAAEKLIRKIHGCFSNHRGV